MLQNWPRLRSSTVFKVAEPRPGEVIVDLREVSKNYITPAGEYPALKTTNLQVYCGEFAVVFGKSGAGKTTLMNMITGIDHPTSGDVYVAGVHLNELSEDDMARWRGMNLGVVFQFFQLFPTMSVIENVVAPMDFCNYLDRSERYPRAMHLLEQVDIAEHAHKLPTEISGGQQQRLAIARALANDPPLIVADEPTGNLDSVTADAVFEVFEELVTRGRTLLIVSHDDDVASRADRVIEIVDGSILAMHPSSET